jgi:hypothetical protein
MLRLSTVKVVEASLVILNVYHLFPEIAAARVVLNPVPVIPVPTVEHVTPLPREICENVKPLIAGLIVAVGAAGHVIVPIPV